MKVGCCCHLQVTEMLKSIRRNTEKIWRYKYFDTNKLKLWKSTLRMFKDTKTRVVLFNDAIPVLYETKFAVCCYFINIIKINVKRQRSESENQDK